MTDAGAIYPGVRFIRTAAMLSESLIVFVDRITADKPHTFDLANHFTTELKAGLPGEKIALPVKEGYQHLQGAAVHRVTQPAAYGPIALAANEPTDVITATGVGRSTEERIPMTIFRRLGQQTTYVWAVALDGAPVKLDAKAADQSVTVKAGPWTLTVNTNSQSVLIAR